MVVHSGLQGVYSCPHLPSDTFTDYPSQAEGTLKFNANIYAWVQSLHITSPEQHICSGAIFAEIDALLQRIDPVQYSRAQNTMPQERSLRPGCKLLPPPGVSTPNKHNVLFSQNSGALQDSPSPHWSLYNLCQVQHVLCTQDPVG